MFKYLTPSIADHDHRYPRIHCRRIPRQYNFPQYQLIRSPIHLVTQGLSTNSPALNALNSSNSSLRLKLYQSVDLNRWQRSRKLKMLAADDNSGFEIAFSGCFSTLKLYLYSSKEILKNKLSLAIEEGDSFGRA